MIRLRKGEFTEKQLRKSIKESTASLEEAKTELLATEQWLAEAEQEYYELSEMIDVKKKFLRCLKSKLTRLLKTNHGNK